MIKPDASRPAELQVYTLTVPNETQSPTTRVVMQVPAGVTQVLVEEAEGWQSEVVRENEVIVRVEWRGTIPVDHFHTFRFIARNPVEEGQVEWRTVQTYADGKEDRWIGAPNSATPAPRTRITEDATPVDILGVAVGGGGQPPPQPSTPEGETDDTEAAPASPGSEDGEDWLALALAAAALAVALAALALSLGAGWRARGRAAP